MYSNTTRSTPSGPIRPTTTPSLPPQTQKAELIMGIFPSNPVDRGFIILGLVQIGVVIAIFFYCFYLFIITGHFLGEGRRRQFQFIDDFMRDFERSRSVRFFRKTYNETQGWIKAHIPRSFGSGSGEKDRNYPRAYHALSGTTVDGGVMSPGLHPPETAYHSNSPHFPQAQISVSRVLRPHPRMVASPSTLSESYIANGGGSATPSHVSRIPRPSSRIYATPSPTSSPCGASFIRLPPSPWPTSMSSPRVAALKPLPRSPMPPMSPTSPSPLPRFVSAITRATASRASRASKPGRDSPLPLLPLRSPTPSIRAPLSRCAPSRAGSERPASTISQARSMMSRARPPMTFRLSGDSEDEDLFFDFLPSDYKKEEKRIGRYDAVTGRMREDDGIPKFFKDLPIVSSPPRAPGVGLGIAGQFGRWGAANRAASGRGTEALGGDPSAADANSRLGVDRGSLRVDGALLSPDIARHTSGRGANTDELGSVRGSLRVNGALRSPSIARHSRCSASIDRTSSTTRQGGPDASINRTSSTTLVPSIDHNSSTTTRQSGRASNIDRGSSITTKQSGPVPNIDRRSSSTTRQSGIAPSIDRSSTATAQSGVVPSIDRASTITARSVRFDVPDPRPMYVESPLVESPFSMRGESPMPMRVESKKYARLVGIEIKDAVMREHTSIPEEANENDKTPKGKGKRNAGEGFESERGQGTKHAYIEEHGNNYEPEHDNMHGKLEHRDSKKQKQNQDFDFQFADKEAIRKETMQGKELWEGDVNVESKHGSGV